MAVAKVQVRMPYDTALPRDAAVNTWYFANPVAVDTLGPDMQSLLDSFYTVTPSGAGAALEAHLSSVLSGTAFVSCYDLADPQPRQAFYTGSFSFTPGAVASPMPSEVAVCFSFQAIPASGVPQSRRRGRVFIGPLNTDALTVTDGIARVDPDLPDILRRCGRRLINDSVASGCEWVVWSPTNNAGYTVQNGWIDDAFDIQRRRGEETTARVTFTPTTP